MSEKNDEQLIFSYLKGDEKSLEILIKRYLKSIYSFAYRNVGNIAEAEDITQEVFLKVWRNFRKFKKEKNFKSWIFQITKNTSIDFLRKKKSIPFSQFENENGQNTLLETLADSQTTLRDNFNTETLNLAIDDLPSRYHIVFKHRYTDGLKFYEIAKLLGEPINTVKSRYRRAVNILKKNINS